MTAPSLSFAAGAFPGIAAVTSEGEAKGGGWPPAMRLAPAVGDDFAARDAARDAFGDAVAVASVDDVIVRLRLGRRAQAGGQRDQRGGERGNDSARGELGRTIAQHDEARNALDTIATFGFPREGSVNRAPSIRRVALDDVRTLAQGELMRLRCSRPLPRRR